MAKTNWQDPGTSEIRSTHISGLMDAVGKLEDSIGMNTIAESNIPLTEVYISENDRYRIFQAPVGKRNWLSSPAPVIKKNGVVITEGFIIDYGGGAIALSVNDTEENTYTADVTYVTQLNTSFKSHLDDGTQHAKTARFVIGTSTAGWTAKDCDYLCDGTADQVEINNAITALSASGGEIIILNGTYNITAKINVNKNNVSIRGNGNATILKRMWNSSSAEGVITLTSVEGCRVQNLQIDGNKANYESTSNIGIYLYSSSNNTITGNTCNNSNISTYLYSSSNNTITGNTCNNSNIGTYLDSSNNNAITGNTCINNSNSGTYLYSSSNNTVTGNTCNNNSYGIYLNSSNNNAITGNTCNNNSNSGIYLNLSSNENTITGNTCNNNSNIGTYLYSSSNNTIKGNTCNNSNIGIYLDSSSNNTITGNICIRGTGQTSDYTSSQYTILLVDSSNNYNLISSNNCMGKAVVVEGGTGNSAWGNKFDNTNDLP